MIQGLRSSFDCASFRAKALAQPAGRFEAALYISSRPIELRYGIQPYFSQQQSGSLVRAALMAGSPGY